MGQPFPLRPGGLRRDTVGLRLYLCFLAVLCAAGCATVNSPPVRLPVDDYTQTGDDHCGPASLAAVYRFWEAAASEADVAARVLNEAEGGTLPLMLVADARRQGFEAAFSRTETDRLVEAVESGVPAICLVESSGARHFVVVQGVRRRRDALDLCVGDGRGRFRWIRGRRWETSWRGGGNLAVFVWPADHAFRPPPLEALEVPRARYSSAEHNDFGVVYEAEGDLQRAEREYRRAVEIDPANAVAWTNYGNVLGAGGKVEAAREAYRRALEVAPGYGPAANNLALTYGDEPQRGLAILDAQASQVDPAYRAALQDVREMLERGGPAGGDEREVN